MDVTMIQSLGNLEIAVALSIDEKKMKIFWTK